ncbi:MAG: iron chaperone [Lautropia sp.]
MNAVPATVDEYIEGFPADIQAVLRAVRVTVRQAAPSAEERISYRMPALFRHGAVVYFGAFKRHLGLFPPVEDPALLAQAARYVGPKGNLQFPYDEPIPHRLIAAVVQARLRANSAKAAATSGRSKGASVRRPARGSGAG